MFAGPIAELVAQRVLTPPARPGLLANLGRFEILRLVGSGGMGVVVLGHDPAAGSTVAIKLVKPELLGDAQIKHRFLKEAGHMQRLAHPGICRSKSRTGRRPLLRHALPRGGKPLRRIARTAYGAGRHSDIAEPVADGLRFAHRRGIIHRDLKPGTSSWEPTAARLADFGLARTVFMMWTQAANSARNGALHVPAVAEGLAEDTRCDIYAFGALLTKC